MKIVNQILYFVFTIVILSTIGVWLPLSIDYFPANKVSAKSLESLPGNLLTYYLSIFFVALVDRVLFLVRDNAYKHKITEILLAGVVAFICLTLTYFAFSKIYQKDYESAVHYCLYATVLSFVLWWIANYKDSKADPYSTLGGHDFN